MIRISLILGLGFGILVGPSNAEEWRLAFQETFDKPGWEKGWSLKGSIGPLDKGDLRNAGRELTVELRKQFDAAAIRVSFDAQISAKGLDGEISDLSCFVGGVFFQFGGQNNTRTQIKSGGVSIGNPKARIELGKLASIVAEINGRVCRFTIDGKQVASMPLKEPFKSFKVTLYTWTGSARFDNLRIETKSKADPLPKEMLAIAEKGFTTPQTLKHLKNWSLPETSPNRPAAKERERVALNVDPGQTEPGMKWPITTGVPLPRDTLWNPDQARVVDEQGNEIPSQRTVTATWSKGGSIRWLLLDFVLTLSKPQPKLFLEFGRKIRPSAITDGVLVKESKQSIEISNGTLQLQISKQRGTIIESLRLGRKGDLLGPSEAYFLTAKGERFTTAVFDGELSVAVEMAGPIRTVIRSRGWYKNEKGERACAFTRRLYVYRGLPMVKLHTTFTITVDTNVYKFRDIGVRFPFVKQSTSPHRIVAATSRNSSTQDWIATSADGAGITLACYEMSRQWPAALETSSDSLTFHAYHNSGGRNLDMTSDGLISFWGEEAFERFQNGRQQYPDLRDRNVNGCGVAKSHELLLSFQADETSGVSRIESRTFPKPPIVSPDPAFVCNTMVAGPGEYHPYDPQRFPEAEAAILDNYRKFLDALDRLDPWVGWWDYGGGMPHYLTDHGDRITYTGYRRGYDIGYQRPLVPWMFYLRSGQRIWLEYAIRNARCMMDVRTQHWTNAPLNTHVGHINSPSCTWSWDSYKSSISFNNTIPYLLLCYYTTGYERAMDVFHETADGYYQSIGVGGGSDYCGVVGIWLGNMASAWRATWDERYLKSFKDLERRQITAQCKYCGGLKIYHLGKDEEHRHGYSHRTGWREFGFIEAAQVDERDPKLDKVFSDFGANVRPAGLRTTYQTLGFSVLHSFRKNGNMLDAQWGDLTLKMYSPLSMVNKFGLSHIRSLPAAMKLALTPGIDDLQDPLTRRIPSPAFINHEGGRPLSFTLHFGAESRHDRPSPVSVIRLDGQSVPNQWITWDPIWGNLKVALPANSPGIYKIEYVAKKANDKLNNWLSFEFDSGKPPPLVSGIPRGIGWGRGKPNKLWFNVPKDTRGFRIRFNIAQRSVTVTRPDGETIQKKKPNLLMDIEVPPNQPDGPWSVEFGYKYKSFNYLFKLNDIPAIVAVDRESLFTLPNPPMPEKDFIGEPSDQTYLDGPPGFGKALLLNSDDELNVPLGTLIEADGANNRRQRFNARRGTIEMFIKLNEDPYFSLASGIPLKVMLDPSVKKRNWNNAVMDWDYKNGINFYHPNGNSYQAGNLGPWDSLPGNIMCVPGKWYHLAVIWDYDQPIEVNRSKKRKFVAVTFLNGRLMPNRMHSHRLEFVLGAIVAPAPADFLIFKSRQHNIIIDEFRISDTCRVIYQGTSTQDFPVPTQPLKHDAHTLLLIHFDGSHQAIGEKSQALETSFKSRTHDVPR